MLDSLHQQIGVPPLVLVFIVFGGLSLVAYWIGTWIGLRINTWWSRRTEQESPSEANFWGRNEVSLPEAWRRISSVKVIRPRASSGGADPISPRTATVHSIDRGQMRVNVWATREGSDSEFGG